MARDLEIHSNVGAGHFLNRVLAMPVNNLPKFQFNRTQVLISLVFLIAMVGLIATIQTVGPEIESALFSKSEQRETHLARYPEAFGGESVVRVATRLTSVVCYLVLATGTVLALRGKERGWRLCRNAAAILIPLTLLNWGIEGIDFYVINREYRKGPFTDLLSTLTGLGSRLEEYNRSHHHGRVLTQVVFIWIIGSIISIYYLLLFLVFGKSRVFAGPRVHSPQEKGHASTNP